MKKYLLVILTIGMVLVLSGCPELWNAVEEILIEPYAYVEDEAGEALAEITVELIKGETVVSTQVSSTTGYVGFGETDEGTYTLRAAETGYVTYEKEVAIAKLAQFLGYITMIDATFEPYAYVVDDSDTAVAGATVILTDASDVEAFSGTTDVDGYVGFGDEEWSGTYTLEISKTGYPTVTEEVTFIKTELFLGTFILNETAFEPYAYVFDDSPAALAGATVTLTAEGETTPAATATSSSIGYVSFGKAEWSGTYTLEASKTGYATVSVDVEIVKTARFLGKIILSSKLTITGKVIDAKTDRDTDDDGTNDVDYTPIDGVTLTLKDGEIQVGNPVVSDTDGTFSFNDVESGTYTIMASKTNCAFIDETVEVLGEDLDVGVILGFPAPDPTTISIIVTWSNSYEDVDAYLTYPSSFKPTPNPPNLDNPYYISDLDGTGFEPATKPLIEPDLENPTREKIHHENTTSANTLGSLEIVEAGDPDFGVPVVELDVDDRDGSGPETISVRYIPFDWLAVWEGTSYDEMWFTTYGSTDKSLTPGVDYAWVGVMEYYVNGTDADSSDGTVSDNLMEEGASGGADVTVYITQGTEVKGRYIIPDYTNVRTAAVIRINLMVEAQYDESSNINGAQELFQILPDIRVFQSDAGIKGISDDSGILVLKGNKISL